MTTESDIICIGNYKVEIFYYKKPRDGYLSTAYCEGDLEADYGQKFLVTYFNGVYASAFPEGLLLTIMYRTSHFRKVNFVEVGKKQGNCEIKVTLSIDYLDWDMAESLGSFVDRYVEEVENALPVKAHADKTEYGYFIECRTPVTETLDIYKSYSALEHSLEKIYRKAVVPNKSNEETSHKYGEGRLHWWIRYVAVPIVCSGTIAAVLGKYFLK